MGPVLSAGYEHVVHHFARWLGTQIFSGCKRDARLQRQPHQLGHGEHAYLLHHAAAMFLDRAKRDAQFRADFLVDQPGDHQPEDFELSWREL